MKLKKVVIFISCLSFSLLAKASTDAVILTTKSEIDVPTATNMVDTGITIENGDVWVWGFRNSSQQGNGREDVSSTTPPARVETFAREGLTITQVAAGIYHIIALDDRGNVWGWGQNGYHEASGGKPANGNYPSLPVLVLENKDVIMINAGEYVSYALTRDGDVYSWGHGIYGQVGNGTYNAINDVYKIPRDKFNGRPIVLIGAAYENGYAIDDRGNIYAWGDEEANAFGRENVPDHRYPNEPVDITNYIPINGEDIVHITGGNSFTAFLTSSGEVYGMGAANHLGLGLDEEAVYDPDGTLITPTRRLAKPQFITDNINMLYCRYAGCAALNENRELLTWGITAGAFQKQVYGSKPTPRSYLGNLTKIDGGKEHLVYWNDEGKAFGVGYNVQNKFGGGSSPVNWPGKELEFVVDEMKKVYGSNYVPGQGL
ncbi:hypothetical protein GQ597_02115 [Gilliamella sp. Pra-s65]|nr:hypothetical protein [Gilliamella sp. Pra-s65]MWP72518.1 hypothetical protein [Gilliamella sp. Pra-s52]